MLSFSDFFAACDGLWKTERIYHDIVTAEIERSYTEFRATTLTGVEKEPILKAIATASSSVQLNLEPESMGDACPGFAVHFDTESETGAQVSMSLKALFVPDALVRVQDSTLQSLPLPAAAQVALDAGSDVLQGFYLRDEGYAEAGAIAGRFTYQPVRQTLEMTTYYNRSVAVDQMRLIAPHLRMRTIVTYRRPAPGIVPTEILLVGFGVERKDEG